MVNSSKQPVSHFVINPSVTKLKCEISNELFRKYSKLTPYALGSCCGMLII